MRTTEKIRSHRDLIFNEQVKVTRAWLRAQEDLPDWLAEVGRYLHQWRSTARLASVSLRWRQESGDSPGEAREALASLEAWRKRDKHLYEYECHLRSQLQGSRKDLYRRFAARMSREYKTAVVEDLNLNEFHRLGNIEEGGSIEKDVAKRYVRDACLSSLFDALKERMREVKEIDPAKTTMQCHACGHVSDWDTKLPVLLKCEGCDLEFDQDVNAARNMLAASGEVVEWDREPLAPMERMSYAPDPNKRRLETLARRKELEMERTTLASAEG
jgi:hypothetical protein